MSEVVMPDATAQAEQQGRATVKIMQDCFKSFGLSDQEANAKIAYLADHLQKSNGSFQFFRFGDVVYTAEVAGKNMVELHAIVGGKTKQDDNYRVKMIRKSLPNVLAALHQLGAEVIYVSMPKKDSKPYDGMMSEFGFTKKDVPEEYGAPDMVAYMVRVR